MAKGSGKNNRKPAKKAAKRAPRKAPRKPAVPAAPRRRGWVWTKRLLAASIWLMIAAGGALVWFAWDLPDPEEAIAATARKPSITLLDRDGGEILRVGDVYGRAVTLAELPTHLPHALLATEDRRFYDHVGVDPIGLARAMWTNFRAGGIRQGGSTLTQQLAKNLFLTRARTIRRKVQEVLLAFWLERKFTKDQLLTVYLNRVYLGSGVYGVDAAARRYFGKPAAKVSLYEAAVLAGLPKAPSSYNPLVAPERAAKRANQVLRNMVAAGWLAADRAKKESRSAVPTRGPRAGNNSRYFADWVLGRVSGYVGAVRQDLVVRTTLAPALQARAGRQMEKTLAAGGKVKMSQGALVSMARDGAVVALLGGRNWRDSQYNRATQALRQPGSSFKTFVYLAALEAGLTPETTEQDREITVEGWSPRNASRSYRGEVSLRESVALSLNAATVALSERVGRDRVIQMARRLGITAPLGADAAIALGTSEVNLLEMTAAYAVVAGGGAAVTPYGILEISDGEGNLLYSREQSPPTRLLERSVAADMQDMLSAVISWGTGKAAAYPGAIAGKTGTSQDYRDAWFIGYDARLVTGVWLGNDNASPMTRVAGGGAPARLWRAFMEEGG